jgi:probable H4MPT-linked C1 transfer pathway protein
LHFEFCIDMTTLGWDIGGVNIKVARVAGHTVLSARSHPFELQLAPDSLVALLRTLAGEIGAASDVRHAVTLTAELSQMFRTKRDGVSFVLGAAQSAFPGADIQVFTVDGAFADVARAMDDPLAVAAANWAATAHVVAQTHPDVLLIDIGTTTTDIIPIVSGRVVADGRTDPDRLASGELVYTGAVRTPVEALTGHVPMRGRIAGVSAEAFALAGDVHVWREQLAAEDYSAPTPDGRPATREFIRERLARIVCADREMLDDTAISAIADAVADAQVARVVDGIRQVLSRHESLKVAIVTGLGAFIAAEAASLVGLEIMPLARELGDAAARCAPAAAVGLLLEHASVAKPTRRIWEPPSGGPDAPTSPHIVDVVIKVGGSLLAFPEHLDRTLETISLVAREARVLIVPGGGPFADTVRHVDERVSLSDDAAHWMAVLAMDQYAQLLAARLDNAVLAENAEAITDALSGSRVPVLAPSRWLRLADPLPHSWEVTSDSIAAWVAGAVDAPHLVLIKAPGASGSQLADGYFARARPAETEVVVVAADRLVAGDLIAAIMRVRATAR